MFKEFIEKWPLRESELIRVWNNSEYIDVEFNILNGGVKATHKSHYNHATKDKRKYFNNLYSSSDLEKLCQSILYDLGFSCILENEIIYNPITGKQVTSLDTTTNGIRMDIRSITENRNKTIENALKAKRKQLHKFNAENKTHLDSLILYFHDPNFFKRPPVIEGLQGSLRRIICVFGNGQYEIIEKNNGS